MDEREALSLTKPVLRTVTGTLTRHCPVNSVKYHLRNIGKATDDGCRLCDEAAKSAKNLLCEFEAVHHQRLSHLGSRQSRTGDGYSPQKRSEVHENTTTRLVNRAGSYNRSYKVKVNARLKNRSYAPPIEGAWLSERLRRWSNKPDVVGSIPVTTEFFVISCDYGPVPKWFGTHYNLEVPL